MSITSMTATGRRVSAVLAVTLSWAMLGVVLPAYADQCKDVSGYSCTPYELEEVPLKKVPALFKFQSRISQAKLPVGDVTFNRIIVNVKSGNQALCTENFAEVKVRDSVLNLLIGSDMSCDLETVIAQNNDLTFQVCIGNQENCLKPVLLSTVPFAIKSNYATLALKADKANEAVQCHYAHRMTADRDLFTSNRIGSGFYDFHTPAPDYIDRLIDMWDVAQSVQDNSYYDGGFIQWMQVDPVTSNLHVCARMAETANGDLTRLKQFVIHADQTKTFGQLIVEGDPRDPEQKSAIINRGLEVSGEAVFNDNVMIGTATGGAGNCQINHDLEVNGPSSFEADSRFNMPATFNHNVSMNAVTTVNERAYFNGLTEFSNVTTYKEDSQLVVNGVADFNGSTTNFNGETHFNNHVFIGQSGATHELKVYHNVVFEGTATFKNSLSALGDVGMKPGPNTVDGETIGTRVVMGEYSPASNGNIPGGGNIGLETITGANIAPNSIGHEDIGPDAVQKDELANNAVYSDNIKDGEVKKADLDEDAVYSLNIKDGEVKSDDIDDETITSADIGPDAVYTSELGNNAVYSANIMDGEVTEADIGPNAVNTSELKNYSVTNAKTNFVVQEITHTVPAGDSISVRLGDFGLCTVSGYANWVKPECEVWHISNRGMPFDVTGATVANGWYLFGNNPHQMDANCYVFCIGLR